MKIKNRPIQKIYRLDFNKIKLGYCMATRHFPLGSHWKKVFTNS